MFTLLQTFVEAELGVLRNPMTPQTRHGLKTDRSCKQRDTHGLPSEPESTGKDAKPFPCPLSLCLYFSPTHKEIKPLSYDISDGFHAM